LKETSDKYETEYNKLMDQAKAKYEELNNMKADELPAIKESKTRDFQDIQNKIAQFEQSAQQSISQMQQELMSPIITKARSAIESVAKEGSYSLIMNADQSMVFYYAQPVEDITNAVKTKLGIK
jgi:Skp family chaperone for outer membrane proteins